MKRWVDSTQAAWLPGQARDSYRRRLLSADYIGPERCSQGWEYCARCRVACGGLPACTPAQHEDVRHACELCPAPGGAAEIMLIITQCWEATTGELLKPTGPTALFGDRRYGRLEEDVKSHAHLQQPWQALHAATVVALDAARRASRPPAFTSRKLHTKPLDEAAQPKLWTTARIVGKIVRVFSRTAQICLQQAVRCKETHRGTHYRDFHNAQSVDSQWNSHASQG